MRTFTLHTNHELIEGIIVRNRKFNEGLYAWAIPVGSPAPMGVYEEQIITKIQRNVVFDIEGKYNVLMEVGSEFKAHMVIIHNQSPINGAWAFEKSPGVEVIAEGYVPRIRNIAQAPGCEYLIEMEPGSVVTVALAGKTNGAPKRFTLKADEESLILAPDSGQSLVGGPLRQLPLPIPARYNQWPK